MWSINYNNQELWAWMDNMITDEQCDYIINKVKQKNDVKTAFLGGKEIDKEYRDSYFSWLKTEDPDWNEIYIKITDAVVYMNKTYFNYDISHIEPLQFTIYDSKESQFYHSHIDSIITSSYPRKLSFSCQLSNPNDYEGGDLRLHISKTPEIASKSRGTATFFNSMLLHDVTPVTSGIRYSLVGWVAGPPFK